MRPPRQFQPLREEDPTVVHRTRCLQRAIGEDCGTAPGFTPLHPAVKLSVCKSFGHHAISLHDIVVTCVYSFAEMDRSEGRRARVVSHLTARGFPSSFSTTSFVDENS